MLAVVVWKVGRADAFLCVRIEHEVVGARKTLEVGAVPMSASGASEALTVLVQGGRGGAVFTSVGLGVPDLLISAGDASSVDNVRKSGWADTFVLVPVIDESSGARLASLQAGVPELVLSASHTSLSIVVWEFGWADAFPCILLEYKIFWA